MMLTTKSRYAVNAILDLAAIQTKEPTGLASLADLQNVPLNYLEQIFSKLKKADLVRAVKGPKGGYILNIDPKDLKIADIIDAVNENLEMSACALKKHSSCTKKLKGKCKTHNLWQGLTKNIRDYFESITLEDVLRGNPTASATKVGAGEFSCIV